jgi:hypothetical protein
MDVIQISQTKINRKESCCSWKLYSRTYESASYCHSHLIAYYFQIFRSLTNYDFKEETESPIKDSEKWAGYDPSRSHTGKYQFSFQWFVSNQTAYYRIQGDSNSIFEETKNSIKDTKRLESETH